ncbi:hypothetical protein BX666DRAFT_2026686 [Dichotomocladium elegans]|nr:hypothetical protein BX666DRAFT_2026686 [Dichotomocladium elegans]
MLPGIAKKRSSNFVLRTSCRLFLRPQQDQDQDLIEAALLRAKTAVQYDADGQVQLAIEAYAETIGLLCQVQQGPTPPVQRIHNAYADRIVALSTRESTEIQESLETYSEGSETTDYYHMHHWSLLKKLKQSMIFGGPIAGRLHVPKELWHKPLVNLPDLEKKLALAEYLLGCLKATRHHPVSDPGLVMQELSRLYQALLLNVQQDLDFKLIQRRKKAARWLSWSKKPVIVVDWIRHKSGSNIDDRYPMYIRTLIKVFTAAQFLDTWYHEYSDLVPSTPSSNAAREQILHKISACAETLGRIVSATVMPDFHLLWDAWVAEVVWSPRTDQRPCQFGKLWYLRMRSLEIRAMVDIVTREACNDLSAVPLPTPPGGRIL